MFLSRIPVRAKLIAAVVIPLLVIAGFVASILLSAQNTREEALTQLVEIGHTEALAEYSEALSDERGTLYHPTAPDSALAEARSSVDEAYDALLVPELGLEDDAVEGAEAVYNEALVIRTELGTSLDAIRTAIRIDTEDSVIHHALHEFDELPAQVLDLSEHEVSDPDALSNLFTILLLQRTHEALASEGASLQEAVTRGTVNEEQIEEIVLSIGKSDEAVDIVLSLGNEDEAEEITEYLAGEEWATYEEIRHAIDETDPGQPITADPLEVLELREAVFEEFESHELHLFEAITNDAQAASTNASRTLIATSLLSLALLAVVGAIVFALYRAIRSPLNYLEQRANTIATVELPEIVRVMREDGDLAEVPVIEEIPVAVDDEIGKLTHAFNGMHQTAVQLAGEQAAARAVVGNMFVNLGRRNQKLLMRLLDSLSDLQAEETDADRLTALYDADHLVTRMRRNAESLLVLAGASSSRTFDRPIPISNVIRAALSEVEGYERVSLDIIDDVLIAEEGIADLSHLSAELIENGLNFSGDREVLVLARYTRTGFILAVIDQGFGMTKEEIDSANERIEKAASSSETPSKNLGHFVVGRLAGRHGMAVELVEGVPAGVAARIRIPKSMIMSAIPDGVEPASAPVEVTAADSDAEFDAIVGNAAVATETASTPERSLPQAAPAPAPASAAAAPASTDEDVFAPPADLEPVGPFAAPRRVAGTNLPDAVRDQPETLDEALGLSSAPRTVAANLSGLQKGMPAERLRRHVPKGDNQ